MEGSEALAATLGTRLKAAGLRLAVAESCTGGLLAAAVTAVPGSSDYFLGGVVAYHNDAKTALLGVPGPMIASDGAVSASVAAAMAEGALLRFGADVAVGVTGVAGPGGGTPDKPVGTVWVAVSVHGVCIPHRLAFPGDREQVRAAAVRESLRLLIAALGGAP